MLFQNIAVTFKGVTYLEPLLLFFSISSVVPVLKGPYYHSTYHTIQAWLGGTPNDEIASYALPYVLYRLYLLVGTVVIRNSKDRL